VNPRLVRPYGWSPILHVDLAKMPDQQRQVHVLGRLSGFSAEGEIAERCYHFYTNKQSQAWGVSPSVWTPWTAAGAASQDTTIESLQELMPYITDEGLAEACRSVVKQRQLLDEINEQLGLALARFLGMSAPASEQDFRELGQRVEDYRLKHGAAWMSQTEIRPLIAQLRDVFVELKSLGFELHARLQPYYVRLAPSYEEIGDQRADDLVDQAIEEPDADLAISLLNEALRYGNTGIQASKAYMGLAGRYSDLGDTEKAIEHYTKSIEASTQPNAFALYWRGELYYQQRQWARARTDFERALALGLFSPEYEQAQAYLSELRARESDQSAS